MALRCRVRTGLRWDCAEPFSRRMPAHTNRTWAWRVGDSIPAVLCASEMVASRRWRVLVLRRAAQSVR